MEHQEPKLDLSVLINKVYRDVLKNLNTEDLLNFRSTSTELKEIVKKYISKYRPTFLRLNCTVSSSKLNPRIEINPPLEAIKGVGMSGMKIKLNILFDLVNMTSFRDNIQILEQIIESLPHAQTIYISFSRPEYYSKETSWLEGTWFNKTASALIKLQELSSLSLSGDAPWEHILKILPYLTTLRKLRVTDNQNLQSVQLLESLSQMKDLTSLSIRSTRGVQETGLPGIGLTNCLPHMPHLHYLSISHVTINGLACEELGKRLERALPNVSELKLENVYIENGEYEEVYYLLPHIRNLLSNLTSLNLSTNGMLNDLIVLSLTGDISNLKSLNISNNSIGEYDEHIGAHPIIPLLESLTNLEELNISGNRIYANCIMELIPTLQRLPLRKLDVSYNYLGEETIEYIRRSLPYVELDETGCHIR